MADFINKNGNIPVAPPTPVAPANPVIPPVTNGSNVNTGKQYEVDNLAPEDLDIMWTRWKCLICNYTYEGSKPLKKCPRCGNEDPDKFEDAD
ncbi:MAG: hypothetical protein UT34_C0001G0196 [candidate division WS6 bacterium GW2011_GWF2_39_15]|uniref:Rubredoxin-like domain-containing protein n=1 Tax=candidate division WS6 bacterium GW2011_GWF2_39_15 TaxID=1619100 RepID=A0A0G0N027_9BACT|nr:MAG: hypothetical protein UT34_C0001G0196 [candidate division WS6 bacterium GW2011_GWF2_39_15]